MTKLKNILQDPFFISFLLLIILGGILAILKITPNIKKGEKKQLVGETITSADKIEIESPEEKSVLQKRNNNWVVLSEEELPADKEKVNILIDTLKKLEKTELVSKNEANQQSFGVNEKETTKLKIYQNDGKLILDLLIGEPGPDFEKDYIRLPSEKETYLSNIALRSVIIQSPWKNLKITEFLSDEVKKVEITVGGKTRSFETEKAKELINNLTGLTANNALLLKGDDLGQYGLDKPKKVINLELERKKIILSFGGTIKNESQYIRLNEDLVIYTISLSKNEGIEKESNKLFSL